MKSLLQNIITSLFINLFAVSPLVGFILPLGSTGWILACAATTVASAAAGYLLQRDCKSPQCIG